MKSMQATIEPKKLEMVGVRRVSEPHKSAQPSSDEEDEEQIEDEEEVSEDEEYNRTSTRRKYDESERGTTTNSKGGRKRIIIDESKLDDEELRKLENRREYNRRCAARARKRSKDLVSTLQQQVDELTNDKAELKRMNDVLRAQLELLEQQNRTLLLSQMAGQIASLPSPTQSLAGAALQPQSNHRFGGGGSNGLGAASSLAGLGGLAGFGGLADAIRGGGGLAQTLRGAGGFPFDDRYQGLSNCLPRGGGGGASGSLSGVDWNRLRDQRF